ncbi:MarR family winged helix-turn-helix transcriptional regulator [Actinomadura sp. HBU206391]|uniref:MarR family winged helix-turn-helix transcriptional regulator n=1 Tax=Actinomadura sp. HBU206391 TaxID=2731692 RepID=UPI00164F2D11|nr:MarR family winged helix-turn-helix transcriptional regulator [Actinomadura sp. HBU206391]MBC6457015.1 winged helix-turn-helix transcriptional regulator [Actinomadura sp. HBU206391]
MDTSAGSRAPTRLRSTPSWLITHLATHAGRLVGEAFEATWARRYHYALLAALEEFGPSSQAELGRRCEIDRSYVVEAINELADRELVVRAQDPADRRRNTITITEAGVRQLHWIDRELEGVQETLLAPLSADERGQLTQLLARALDHHAQKRG